VEAYLARDNGYRMVIVIAGTKKPLFAQSRNRLYRDLRLGSRPDRKWQNFAIPPQPANARRSIQDTLDDWQDDSVPEAQRQTVLVTVMKHHSHLTYLTGVLSGIDLRSVPVLVIDDEADQAGLNTQVRDGDESRTYSCLLGLRASLPQHSLLQYTATLQAPLLINIIDSLSPSFAEVLTPGDQYVGGRDFFIQQPNLVRSIPVAEIPTRNRQLNEPPDSLMDAMRLFLVGVAAGYHLENGQGNRSMMVHPSRETMRHGQYARWVRDIKTLWQQAIELPEGNLDRQDLIDEFAVAHADLAATLPTLPPLATLFPELRRAIRRTLVTEVNVARGETPEIDWGSTYAHILVGGQAMDRGFTVEGLTVTYMPRGTGVGNADTVQQRARFFGYKRAYLGYCRVFLENAAQTDFGRYVAHEEDIRARMVAHRDAGLHLRDWKRAFFLSSAMQPTRKNVLDLDYMRGNYSDDWFTPKIPHDTDEAVEYKAPSVRFPPVNCRLTAALRVSASGPKNLKSKDVAWARVMYCSWWP
jgi:hypothetical protein